MIVITDKVDVERRAFEVAEELASRSFYAKVLDERTRLFPPIRDAMLEAFQAGRASRPFRSAVKRIVSRFSRRQP
jgi:hypothetical protein